MNDAPISRSVLSDQVKDRLLQAILAGHYPPGSRIVETRVARELGTSQAPVREALRDLEALGVVEISRIPRGPRPPSDARPSSSRPTASGPSSSRWRPPRAAADDGRGPRGARRATSTRCGRAADAGDTHARGRRPTSASTPASSRSPATARSSGSGATWSRSRAPTSRSWSPARTRARSPTSTPRSSTRSAAATRNWSWRPTTSTSRRPARCSAAAGSTSRRHRTRSLASRVATSVPDGETSAQGRRQSDAVARLARPRARRRTNR